MKIRIVYIFMNPPVTLLALPIGGPIEDLYEKEGIVTKMVLESQSPLVQEKIHEYILSEVEARRVNGVISLAWPALLSMVRKPQ